MTKPSVSSPGSLLFTNSSQPTQLDDMKGTSQINIHRFFFEQVEKKAAQATSCLGFMWKMIECMMVIVLMCRLAAVGRLCDAADEAEWTVVMATR